MSGPDPRYPIGRLEPHARLDAAQRAEAVARIERALTALRRAVTGLTDVEWNTPYRDGGWTIRQVVHHLADAHLNGFARFRFALTEPDSPIRPYDQAAWARLPDNDATPPEVSIALLEALHRRWVDLLRALPEDAFQQEVYHPGRQRTVTLDELVGLYAWHGDHHVAHIRQARARAARDGAATTAPRATVTS